MSRGPGRVQRFILDRLAEHNAELVGTEEDGNYAARWCWACVLAYECFIGPAPDPLPPPRDRPLTAAQDETVRRACRLLAKAGKVELGHGISRFYTGWTRHGDDENWMSGGRDLRVRLPLTAAETEAEREYDRRRDAEVTATLGRIFGVEQPARPPEPDGPRPFVVTPSGEASRE